ncbi:MAG: hypothetical protein AMXMBFR53_33250 [Gemmatimonadota bacterium]
MPDTVGEGKVARLALFGGPAVERASGEAVPLTLQQQRLLALVWGHGPRGVSRKTAIWLLWEEDDDRRSRHRLRQALHDLASRLGFRPVVADADDALLPAHRVVASDLEEFQEALGDGRLEGALALLRSGFASALDGRQVGKELDDWLEAKREALRRKLRDAAVWRWDRYRPVGAWEPTREAAEVLAALDPESETAACRLVEARAMTGNVEAAEAALADYMRRLPPGGTPAPGTVELIERIRRLDPAPHFTASSAPPPPPLVGRRHSLATARRMLGRVGEGSFEFLLIRGEAGAGKTRLMEEIWKEANLAGFRCLEARPAEVERRIPLSPLVDMLGDPGVAKYIRAMEEPWRAVVASVLPSLPDGMEPPVVPPIAESSLSRRLYDAFATLFSDMAEEEPVLLFIDDLQWADATTVAVLQFVQRRWTTGPLGIVATIRPELVETSEGVAKYLVESADLPVTTVELGDLTDEEASTLVTLVAGKDIEPSMVARLCALGGRNPFYLIELTRDYLAGKLHLPELPTDAITLPISLRQLLEPRIKALGPDAAGIGAYLAVWGRPVSLPDLLRLARMPAAEGTRHSEELEQCRLVVVERGRIRLAHELIRGAIYQGLTATRRAFLHGEIAAFLEEADSPPEGELAIHYDRAGGAEGAASHGRKAADRALESGAMAEAAYFLQLVVENESNERRKAEATADLAKVLHMNREIIRANPLLELAATRLRAVGLHTRALRVDIRRVEGLAELGAAPLSELLDRLSTIKAAARAAGDDEALALALDSELHILHRSGEVEAIQSLFDEIRVVAASPDPAAACLANASLALNVLFGDPDEALRCAREAVRVAEEGEVGAHLLRAYSRLVLVLIYLGQLHREEGSALMAKAATVAGRSGDLTLKAYLALNEGVYAMERSQFDFAQDCFLRTARLLERSEPGLPHATLHLNRGELLLRQREFPDAFAAFSRASRITTASTPRYVMNLINAGLGVCALEIGDLTLARDLDSVVHGEPYWYYDPTLVLLFRSRMLARRAGSGQALSDLECGAAAIRRRLPIAWMKLIFLADRSRRRLRMASSSELQEAIALAEDLGLSASDDLARH